MKILKSISTKKLIAIGVLLVVLPTLVNDFWPIPHFVRGFFTGVGLGIEIMAIIKMRREKAKAEPTV